MKIWRYTFRDDNSPSGTVNWWFATKRELDKARRETEANPPFGYQLFSIEQIIIPDRKADLIYWLNHEI